ncbi:MAG: DUF1175 family protein [Blastocatellia bacterium]|nr:DUF1175 family protein [Blastocatellia bacterium]
MIAAHRSLTSCCCLLLLAFGIACTHEPQARTEAKKPTPAPVPSWLDSDQDGFPDSVELTSASDRASFRKWFTAIAEMQFYQLSDAWNVEQRDCAGLVRFAMREALRKHDRLWFQKMGAGYEAIAPDVQALQLEKSLLGEKLFRTEFGSFQKSDVPGNKFSEFADARTLKNYNATYISRDATQAQPGDLLFYQQAFAQRYPYHVMIFLGAARQANESANDWVIYHTGISPDDKGTIKKVRLSVLAQHPDPRWRPVENNKNFLGFFRLKILQ